MNTADRVKIVIVDDYADLTETLSMLLVEFGYSVSTASNGVSGLALVESLRPHCVLMDVRMAGGGGWELASKIRETYGNDIVLIAMSAFRENDPEVAATFAIVDHYFHKPFELTALEKVLPRLKEAGVSFPA